MQAALAIGVAQPPGFQLGEVPGACRGARRFADWANSQGFRVGKFFDDQKPVTHRDIRKWVERVVRRQELQGDVERFFIYFAGHGFDDSSGTAFQWLLSNAGRDHGQIIDIESSCRTANYYSGIPHVAFFGDTCRTRPPYGVPEGDSIFPIPQALPNDFIPADKFYSTLPNMSSFEDGDDPECVGIYSHCLLEALEGLAPQALIATPEKTAKASHAVVSGSLAKYLTPAVRKYSANVLGHIQTPYSYPTSEWEPDVVAWINRGSMPVEPEPPPAEAPDGNPDDPDEYPEQVQEVAENLRATIAGRETGALLSVVETRTELSRHDKDRKVYAELSRGFSPSLDAAPVLKLLTPSRDHTVWALPDMPRPQPGPALINLDAFWAKRPLWAAVAHFPGFTTQMRVDKWGVQHLAYLNINGQSDIDLVAHITARARLGLLAHQDNEDMRRSIERQFDPVLAIALAYSLDSTVGWEGVRDLLSLLRERKVPIPFDVALLADRKFPTANDVVPGFPMAARGWRVLRYTPGRSQTLASMIKSHLAPAYWTTLWDPSKSLRRHLLLRDPLDP